ncbi:unnamed protein product, partial [Chrysoparadoxa australica]
LDDEGDRIDRLAEFHLKKQLGQDRLRNDPDAAAARLIKETYRQAPPGGVFWAVDTLGEKWRDDGDAAGDIFALRVALSLAKANYDHRAKGKKPLEASALFTLGWGHLRIAERSTNDRHLTVAKTAFEAAVSKTNKAKDPVNWSSRQDGLGNVFSEMGLRTADPEQLRAAVTAFRAALEIDLKTNAVGLKYRWNNLGITLCRLG